LKRKGHLKKQTVESLNKTFDNEIEQIDQSLFKISKLLMLCYGEAGATVVSRMINNESAVLDFANERGNKVMAIFAYCDIRNFTDATEVFQETVISFVNHVANIVHTQTVRHGGQPNKNIGDAFLLVWRLSKTPEEFHKLKPIVKKATTLKKENLNSYETKNDINDNLQKEASIMADLSLLSVLKITASVYHSKELQRYNDDPIMNKRMPGFKLKLGFGIHLGWAIEGLIGSSFKADASYLSPNVNRSARLEAATKQYGVQTLLSDAVFSLLSNPYKAITRIVDCVSFSSKRKDYSDIYTVDIDMGN